MPSESEQRLAAREAAGPPPADASAVAIAAQQPTTVPVAPISMSRPLHMTVLAVAAPVLVDQFLQMLLWWSDMILAGGLKPHAREMISAVGMSGQLLHIVGVLFTAVGAGAMALVARSIGSGDRELANRVARQAMILGMLIGAAMAVTMEIAAPHILFGLGLRDATLEAATLYARIIMPGLCVGSLMFMGGACLRGAGDTRGALLAVALANSVNIFVSWTLCKGWFGVPAMGLRGIALGTFAAFVVGGLFMLYLVRSGQRGICVRFRPISLQFGLISRIFRIGSFAGLESVVFASASVIVSSIVAHPPLGTGDFAAFMLSLRIESLSFLPGFAFGVAGGALVGQALGAGRPKQASHYGLWSYALGGTVMTVVGLIFICWPEVFVRIFISQEDGADVVAKTTAMVRICGIIQPFLGLIMVFAGCLKGAGDTRYPAAITIGGVWLLRIPGVFIAARVFNSGVIGVWCVMMSDLVVRGLLVGWRFMHGGWKKTKV